MKYLPLAVCIATALATSSTLADQGHDADWSEEAQFKMMDADSDGKVTTNEHAAAAKSMFTKMDVNKDGKVTASEMDASHGAHGGTKRKPGHADKQHPDQQRQAMTSAQKIAVIDEDKDGAVTATEHATGSQEMFSKMDADKSGDLTLRECREGHKKMMTAADTE